MAGRRSSRRGHRARRHGEAAGLQWTSERNPDNTFGRRGFYPLPAKLSSLGRFVENLAPFRLIGHKVFVDERRPTIHMLTARVDGRFSIMRKDMESLLKHGLVRMQSNDPGTIAFYFEE